MILPIYTYGNGVLRKPTEEIDSSYPAVNELIANMFDTLTHADGCGLAAPQVGLSIRLFVVDGTLLDKDYPECKGFKKVFINPEIVEQSEETSAYDEGCLSLPGINERVVRPRTITIRYLDENFEAHEEEYSDFAARIILHEYDHLEGHVFTDRISMIRKQLVNNKLRKIQDKKVSCRYKIK